MVEYKYPGINLDLKYPTGRWNTNEYTSHPQGEVPLPIREVFMMTMMDQLTDKPDWHKKVFDEAIVSKWRKEALEQSEEGLFNFIIYESRSRYGSGQVLEQNIDHRWTLERGLTKARTVPFPRCRILSELAFEFCIRELRAKAAHFERTGLIPALDVHGRAVVKSDSVVPEDLKTRLCDIFAQLRTDQSATGLDWHPRSNEQVLDLVHPSLYPFVYGRSPFFQDEVVGVKDAIETWAGKGEKAPADPTLATPADADEFSRTKIGEGDDWSAKYQWLPANIVLQDGSARFSSYINNLHPQKYAHVYRAIEELIDIAIPAWDQALTECGRLDSRFSLPKEADDRETEGLWEEFNPEILASYNLEPTEEDLWDLAGSFQWDDVETIEDIKSRHADAIETWKWELVRDAILPEPDSDAKVDYTCKESIRDMFKDSGLQIYVKMARIELTPDKPDFPAGGWHVEGMINERICATALYYLDSENITTSALDFRMTTIGDQDQLQRTHGQDAYNWLERVYGVDFQSDYCLQYYGRVETREGRLLAFPNFLLVDPTQRVVSTANVPPQQLDWWLEAAFGRNQGNPGDMPAEIAQLLLGKPELAEKLPEKLKERANGGRLPNEIHEMVRREAHIASGLMSLDEAKEHRLHIMDERSVHATQVNEGVTVESYGFCEH